jgi:hypothetical protein
MIHELGQPPFYKIEQELPLGRRTVKFVRWELGNRTIEKKADWLTLGYIRRLLWKG